MPVAVKRACVFARMRKAFEIRYISCKIYILIVFYSRCQLRAVVDSRARSRLRRRITALPFVDGRQRSNFHRILRDIDSAIESAVVAAPVAYRSRKLPEYNGTAVVAESIFVAVLCTVTYFYGYSIIDYSVFTYSHFRQII